MDEESWSIDHAIPKSRGGDNQTHNLYCACKKCNVLKDNKTPKEFKIFVGKMISLHKKGIIEIKEIDYFKKIYSRLQHKIK